MHAKAYVFAAFAVAVLLAAPGAAATDPPTMYAQEEQQFHAALPAGVDTVDAAGAVAGWRGWHGFMYGESSSLTNLRIALDRVDPSWTFTPAVGPFPISMEVPTLAQYNPFDLRTLSGDGGAKVDLQFAPGVDVARTVTTTTNADGTSTAHVRLATRALDPRWQSGVTLYVFVGTGTGYASVDPATITGPPATHVDFGQQYVQWSMPSTSDWAVGTFDITLPREPVEPASYRPYVWIFAHGSTPPAVADGVSASIADPELGGTWTFSADQTVRWFTATLSQLILELPAVVHVQPPPVPAYASVYRGATAFVPGALDRVSADATYPGRWQWSPQIGNWSDKDLPSPAISLDGVAPLWTLPLTALPPFPIVESAPTLWAGSNFPFDRRYDAIEKPLGSGFGFWGDVRSGLDVTRTLVAPATEAVPPGGATQRWSVTLTTRDATLGGAQLSVEIPPAGSGGTGSVVPETVEWPLLGDGERLYQTDTSNGRLYWSIGSAVVGKAYTVTFDVRVANAAVLPMILRPAVWAFAAPPSHALPGVVGTSASIRDEALGGTFDFSLGVRAQWYLTAGSMMQVSWGQYGPMPAPDRVVLADAAEGAAVLGVTAATADLRAALDPALWADDLHLVPDTGQRVFQLAKTAALRLEQSTAPPVGARSCEALAVEVRLAARRLANRAIDEAARVADGPQLEAARAQLALGAADAAADAIDHYKNAWNMALQTLRQGAPDQTR